MWQLLPLKYGLSIHQWATPELNDDPGMEAVKLEEVKAADVELNVVGLDVVLWVGLELVDEARKVESTELEAT